MMILQVEFFQLFNMGYQNYSQGEWQVARRMLFGISGSARGLVACCWDSWSQIHGGLVVVVIMGNILRIWNL